MNTPMLETIADDLVMCSEAVRKVKSIEELTQALFVLGISQDRLKHELVKIMKEKVA